MTEKKTPTAEQPAATPATHFAEGIAVPIQAATPATVLPGSMPTAAEVAKEWGTWVAVAPIFVGNARAFNPGDAVPASHPYLIEGDHGQGWIADGSVAPKDK